MVKIYMDKNIYIFLKIFIKNKHELSIYSGNFELDLKIKEKIQ